MSKLTRAAVYLMVICFGFGTYIHDANAHRRAPAGVELEIPHAAFVKFGLGGAVGFRLNIPIRRGMADVLYFGIGVDSYYSNYRDRYGFGFGVPLVLQWSLYLTDIFSLYFELGANVWVHEGFFLGEPLAFSPAWVIGAIGMRFRLTHNISLQLRFGAPYSSFGLSFFF